MFVTELSQVEPLYYENFNLKDIVTPVCIEPLIKQLRQAGYDKEKIEYLEQGFSEGFNIGYQGPEKRQSKSNNIPLRVGNKTELWNKLMKEVQLK